MAKTIKTINIVVFIAWIALLSLLLYREYTGTPLEKQEAVKGAIDRVTYWYDIYSGSNKVGFGSYTFQWVGDEIIITYEQEVKIKQGDREKLLVENYRCLSNSSYAIKSFEYSFHYKDEKGIKVTGEVDADTVVFFLESPEKRKTYRTSTKGKAIYLPITFIPAIIQKNPSSRSVFAVQVLDIANLSVNDIRVEVEEIRPVKLGTQVVSYYKIRAGNQIFWSNEKGITIEEEYPGGITYYLQTETIAKDPKDRVLFDYISLPFLRSNKILKDAEKLKLLKVRIKGFPLDRGIYSNSLVTLRNDTLIIQKEDQEEFKKRSYLLPCKDQTVSRYLMADDWVLSDDKTVKGNALNMAAVEKNDAFRLAQYLNANLYSTVKTMPLFVLTDSLDIFKSHFGDYIERSVMFASFGRAVGLPTRLVGGLVYRDGYFYFHTWPEAWLGKWIPMEPTLAQFPADVTHIPLKEGTLKDIISVAEGLKSLNLEILEAL